MCRSASQGGRRCRSSSRRNRHAARLRQRVFRARRALTTAQDSGDATAIATAQQRLDQAEHARHHATTSRKAPTVTTTPDPTNNPTITSPAGTDERNTAGQHRDVTTPQVINTVDGTNTGIQADTITGGITFGSPGSPVTIGNTAGQLGDVTPPRTGNHGDVTHTVGGRVTGIQADTITGGVHLDRPGGNIIIGATAGQHGDVTTSSAGRSPGVVNTVGGTNTGIQAGTVTGGITFGQHPATEPTPAQSGDVTPPRSEDRGNVGQVNNYATNPGVQGGIVNGAVVVNGRVADARLADQIRQAADHARRAAQRAADDVTAGRGQSIHVGAGEPGDVTGHRADTATSTGQARPLPDDVRAQLAALGIQVGSITGSVIVNGRRIH